ncbi:L,D-transpeptidase family protein [Thalassoglobus sp.]|uniref:L,D-transpeptidase family protein n=1 Tax=Thalassoglobus sp. TaxID=2795869 RepID=UPI003AA7E824
MFEYQPRRHPLQTFQFWFAVLVCAGGVAVWRFGIFSQTPQTVNLPPAISDETMPPPPQSGSIVRVPEQFEQKSSEKKHNVAMAPQQSEEPLDETLPENRAAQPISEVGGETSGTMDGNSASTRDLEIQTASGIQQHGYKIEQTSIQQTNLGSQPRGEEHHSTGLTFRAQPEASTELPVISPALSAQFDFTEVDQLIESGDDVAALRTLSTWYWEYPERRRQLWHRLNLLSRRIYFQPHPHYMEPYEIQFGDRLETIARQHQVSWEYLSKINRVDAQRIKAGKKLKVIQGPFSAVVDLTKFEVTVHAHGYFVVRMPVGIGKDGSTPIGKFKVTDKVVDPIYYGPDIVIKNDDPTNPLGERWLAISDEAGTLEGYGIHGTIDPDSIGKADSRGCIRLHDQDVADLYDLLTIGSEVIIRR